MAGPRRRISKVNDVEPCAYLLRSFLRKKIQINLE